MHGTTLGLAAILLSTACTLNARPSQPLKAIPGQVLLGTFNTLQEMKSSIVIKNTARETLVVEAIKADCSCLGATLTDTEIAPGRTTTLEIATALRTEGEFSHAILIVPKDRTKYIPLRIPIKGKAVQPAACAVGWKGCAPIWTNPTRAADLGIVHQACVSPMIYITAKNERFHVQDAVMDVNSAAFELYQYRFVAPSHQGALQADAGDHGTWLVLSLAPKEPPKAGMLRDLVSVSLAPNVNIEVPFVCRVVGDVYPEPQHIRLGGLASCQPAYLSVRFVNGHPQWNQVKWCMSGYLSEGIAIEQVPAQTPADDIRLKMTTVSPMLMRLPKGYLFARVTLFQNEPTEDDAISVLIDGQN